MWSSEVLRPKPHNKPRIHPCFQQLHSSVRTGNLETCLRLLSLGAQANFFHPVSFKSHKDISKFSVVVNLMFKQHIRYSNYTNTETEKKKKCLVGISKLVYQRTDLSLRYLLSELNINQMCKYCVLHGSIDRFLHVDPPLRWNKILFCFLCCSFHALHSRSCALLSLTELLQWMSFVFFRRKEILHYMWQLKQASCYRQSCSLCMEQIPEHLIVLGRLLLTTPGERDADLRDQYKD